MNKNYIITRDKLIVTTENGDVDVLQNTESNLNKKKLENDLRVLKDKLNKAKNDFITHDSNFKISLIIAIVFAIIVFATSGLTSALNSFILGILDLIIIVFSLKEDDKSELEKKNIKCIEEMIECTRNKYLVECTKQKTMPKTNNFDGCLVQEFSNGVFANKTERFLMLISVYERYKKKYLKYYRKNRSLNGLNFSEEERIFLERVILCDLGVENNYVDVHENGRSLIKC